MNNDNVLSPVIIIGMHRSGTSLLARILENLGLYMGMKKEHNHEALFFLELNNWLLNTVGADWDNPRSLEPVLNKPALKELTLEYLKIKMKSLQAISYMGFQQYLRLGSIMNMQKPWGFKDPRSTFTLPVWKELFLNAKIVHIYRHGVDVADSLVRRSQSAFKNNERLFNKRKYLYSFYNKRSGFTDSCLCMDHEEAFKIWVSYIQEAKKQAKTYLQDAIEMKYEDFLTDPYGKIKIILDFLEISSSDDEIYRQIKGIQSGRAYAFQRNENLREIAEKNSHILNEFGY